MFSKKPVVWLCVAAALTLGACGGDDAAGDSAATPPPTSAESQSTGTVQGTSESGATTSASDSTAVTNEEPTTTSSGGESVVSGGTLTVLQCCDPRNFDPTAQLGARIATDAMALLPVFDALLYEDGATNEVVPMLAERLEATNPPLGWTLKLRDGVLFSDGTTLDAEAVVFNWERHADPVNASAAKSVMDNIASMEVIDPLTVEVTLVSPDATFPRSVARYLSYIGSPTALADPAAFAEHPVGAGPFVLTQWTRDGEIRFERNPNYWDAPRPYVDELVLKTVPDAAQRYNTLISGDGHLEAMLADYQNSGAGVETGDFVRWPADLAGPVGGAGFFLNMTTEPFDDPLARQALRAAWDMKSTLDAAFFGVVEPPVSLFSESSEFYNPAYDYPEFDAEEAQRLLDEYAAKHGAPLTFTMVGTPNSIGVAQAAQAQMAQFQNLVVDTETVETSEIQKRGIDGNFQAIAGLASASDPNLTLYDVFSSGSTRNFSRYSNAEVDEALQIGRTSLDPAERRAAFDVVNEHIFNDIPWIHFNSSTTGAGYLVSTEVEGFRETWRGPLFNEVWLNPDD